MGVGIAFSHGQCEGQVHSHTGDAWQDGSGGHAQNTMAVRPTAVGREGTFVKVCSEEVERGMEKQVDGARGPVLPEELEEGSRAGLGSHRPEICNASSLTSGH